MQSNQIHEQQNQAVNAAAFAAKFRSKRGKCHHITDLVNAEIFTFLTVDVKAYLPPIQTVTVYFMKDLVTGVRKYVPMDRVVHIHVPAYESLKLEEIFSFFLQN